MGMNRKTGRGAKFLIVFVVIVIIMAAVTFFAGKYAYHLLRENMRRNKVRKWF